MSPRPSLLAACCAGLFALPPAMAESASASASITGLSYQLIDLDLNDGIAPAISFVEYLDSTSFVVEGTNGGEQDVIDVYGSTSIVRPWGGAASTSSASGSSAEASLSDPVPDYHQSGAFINYRMLFTMTPFTRIEFSADATVGALRAGENVDGYGFARMDADLDDPRGRQTYVEYVSTIEGPRSRSMWGYLESGEYATAGRWNTLTTATTYGQLTVPEPSTYAMLLAGVGLVGWRMRRTRADSSAEDA